jgi:hypothetical protein
VIAIVPFEVGHLARIEPPLVSPGRAAAHPPASVIGPAFTAIAEDGAVLGCAGVVVHGSVGEAWAVLSDEARRRPLFLHRRVKRGLAAIVREHGLLRVEAAAHGDHPAAQSWLRRLGFREDGAEPNYLGTGHTYVRYVK